MFCVQQSKPAQSKLASELCAVTTAQNSEVIFVRAVRTAHMTSSNAVLSSDLGGVSEAKASRGSLRYFKAQMRKE
jgi:hypothetical protein